MDEGENRSDAEEYDCPGHGSCPSAALANSASIPAHCTRSVKYCAQLLVTLAMPLQFAVLQFNERNARPFGCESNLHFARLGHVGVAYPIR